MQAVAASVLTLTEGRQISPEEKQKRSSIKISIFQCTLLGTVVIQEANKTTLKIECLKNGSKFRKIVEKLSHFYLVYKYVCFRIIR